MKISMPYLAPFPTSGIARGFPARASRTGGDVPDRLPRDVRSAGMDRRPSGESGSTSFPRERGGAQERDVPRAAMAPRRSCKSDSTPGALIGLPATGSITPSPTQRNTEQAGSSDGGQRTNLNSGFTPRRARPTRSAQCGSPACEGVAPVPRSSLFVVVLRGSDTQLL
jgi:hypothetical protein